MSRLLKKNCLHWLESLLKERFQPELRLHTQADGQLQLVLPTQTAVIKLPPLSNCFFQAQNNLPCTHWDSTTEGWPTLLNQPLPAPGVDKLPSPLISKADSHYSIAYDILGLTYWMLTRQEEIGSTNLDQHGRFPATASHAYKHHYLERPIVDEWLAILRQVIQRTWPELKLKQPQFSLKVSHDVDKPSLYGFCTPKTLIRLIGSDLIKRRDVKSLLIAPWIRLNTQQNLHPQDPYNTFDWLMNLSDHYGLTSAFYFICGGSSPHDADYQAEHPAIRALIRRIHQRGHEVGLHPSYNTYQNPQAIITEAQRLKKICSEEGVQQAQWGGRMHYLRWEQPTTLQGWEQAGMDYDSTLGYADSPGFRCGTCFEYPAFDPVKQERLNLRIRPLVVMESSIIAENYMGLGYSEQALNAFLNLKTICRKVGGQFTLLWHNSYFAHQKAKQLYQNMLAL